MEIQISGALNQGSLKVSHSKESNVSEKILRSPTTTTTLIVSQDLFSSFVPCNAASPENLAEIDDEDDEDEESPSKPPQEVSLVPTLEEDQMETEVDTSDLETSVLKSPVTPEPNMFLNEDSMGFDNLQALNIVTPCVDSTQAFIGLLSKNLSPIKRKCFRTDPEPEPLNSTQTYFNLTKHYKLLSEERKKVLYGGRDCEESNSSMSATKPLRRKLFNQEDELAADATEKENIKYDDGDYKLESFEDEWKKVSILKSDRKEDTPNKGDSVDMEPDISSPGVSVVEVSVVTSKGPFHVHDSFKTPDNRVSKANMVISPNDLDVNVPAMVIEETVCTVSEEIATCIHQQEEDEITANLNSIKDKNTLTESLPAEDQEVNLVPGQRDNIQVSFDTKCQISPVSNENISVDQSDCPEHTVTKEIDVVSHNSESRSQDTGKNDIVPKPCIFTTQLESAVSNGKDLIGCKRPFIARKTFNPENRVYKRARTADTETGERPINCPELVQELFRVTDTPASGFPAYPPPISRIVPIPIPDMPVRKRTGLLRRSSVRPSLHPYIARNILVHEE